MPDLIVLVPGIGGSFLRKGDQDVWSLNRGSILNCIRTLGRSLQTLQLASDPPEVDDLEDGVSAVGLFRDTHLIPGLWKIDGYTKLTQQLLREFEVDRGRNFREFAYDWRRDNRVAARRLARLSQDWLRIWRKQSGNPNAKLVLLAHSMGGLVSRYFLECLDGWRDTRALITFGTPYRGSLNALNFLCKGFKKQIAGVDILDLTALLRSFTSVYQLLPTYPCYDPGDGTLSRPGETQEIPGVDAQRAADALDFHKRITRAVEAHAKSKEYVADGYAIHPIIGTSQPTLQVAKRVGNSVEFSVRHPKDRWMDGDGTVSRRSARPIEFDNIKAPGEHFLPEAHGSLQNADGAFVQIFGLLARTADASFRGATGAISLSIDDVYAGGEPIIIRAQSSQQGSLNAILVNTRDDHEVGRASMRVLEDGTAVAEFAPLREGTYRVTVSGELPSGEAGIIAAPPVHDVFVVAER